MRTLTTLRRTLMLAVALTATFTAYGLLAPAEAQADGVARGVRRIGYRHGARRVVPRHGRRVRNYGYRGGHHGNAYFAPVYGHGNYATPWHGGYGYGHYNAVPYYGNGGHYGSGIHFSFGH